MTLLPNITSLVSRIKPKRPMPGKRPLDLHIDWQPETGHVVLKQDIQQDIDDKNRILTLLETVQCSTKTKKNIICLYDTFGKERIFGRTEVINVLTITPSPASALIKKMLELGLIENVRGLGKGKYRFVRC